MIRGKPWAVYWRKKKQGFINILGRCNHWDHELEIREEQPELEKVDTMLHEMLHGEFPEASEKRIAQAATELTQALLRMGCF